MISIVIGSWGSYNECNERALGSKWLDLSDYSDWEEIEEALKKQGFELDGIDEELFIQDVDGIPNNSCNWDYVNPQQLFETLLESGILDDDDLYELFEAYLEVNSFDNWENLVSSYGSHWHNDINLYKLAEKAESAKEYLKGFYEQLKEDDFIIIEVESYYCVAVVLDYTLPYIVGDHIAPFDENRTYPLQGLETKFAFKRY